MKPADSGWESHSAAFAPEQESQFALSCRLQMPRLYQRIASAIYE